MNQPPLSSRLGITSPNNPFTKAVKATLPSLAAAPIAPRAGASSKQGNPFMTGLNSDSPEFKASYGVNKPLKDPMFVGYRDDQPVFAGGRLFILY